MGVNLVINNGVKKRKIAQYELVFSLMADGKWRTLEEILKEISGSHSITGISARLRDFRKPKHGNHDVLKQRRGGDLWEYRLVISPYADSAAAFFSKKIVA